MDIYCPKCGEPCDIYELHDVEGMSYAQASAKFRRDGCEVFGSKHADYYAPSQNVRASMAEAVYGVLGEDLDGAASMLEDFEYLSA